MPETITVNQTVTTTLDFKELPEVGSTLPPDAFGCHVRVAKPIPGLLVLEHSRNGKKAYVLETTENRQDAPASLAYVVEIDGHRCETLSHKRLRRWLFCVADVEPTVNNPPTIQSNEIDWDTYQDLVLFEIPSKIFGVDTRQTGARPCLGVRVPWACDGFATLELGQCLGYFPITLRDPVTLQLVRDNRVRMGFPQPANVLGVSNDTLGMKLDTGHCWSQIEAYNAAKGTVLERYYAESVEALAVYCCMADYNNLWKKELRGAGRSMRAAVDWLTICGGSDSFVLQHLKAAVAHYFNLPMLKCYSGVRFAKGDFWSVAPFEWVHVLYSLYLGSQAGLINGVVENYIKAALLWFSRFPGVPNELQVSDATGKSAEVWPVEKSVSCEEAKFAANPKRYDTELNNAFVLDWLRHQLDLPTTRPLDDPAYTKWLNTANSAGFWLRWEPKPKWTFSGKTFTDLREAKQALRMDVSTKCDGYDGEGVFDYSGQIVRV